MKEEYNTLLRTNEELAKQVKLEYQKSIEKKAADMLVENYLDAINHFFHSYDSERIINRINKELESMLSYGYMTESEIVTLEIVSMRDIWFKLPEGRNIKTVVQEIVVTPEIYWLEKLRQVEFF